MIYRPFPLELFHGSSGVHSETLLKHAIMLGVVNINCLRVCASRVRINGKIVSENFQYIIFFLESVLIIKRKWRLVASKKYVHDNEDG